MEELKKIIDMAQAAGLTGESLSVFLRDERAARREAEKCQAEWEEKEREHARQLELFNMRKVELEHQLQMLQVQHQQELALAQARVTSQDNSSGQDISKSLKLLAFDERGYGCIFTQVWAVCQKTWLISWWMGFQSEYFIER